MFAIFLTPKILPNLKCIVRRHFQQAQPLKLAGVPSRNIASFKKQYWAMGTYIYQVPKEGGGNQVHSILQWNKVDLVNDFLLLKINQLKDSLKSGKLWTDFILVAYKVHSLKSHEKFLKKYMIFTLAKKVSSQAIQKK